MNKVLEKSAKNYLSKLSKLLSNNDLECKYYKWLSDESRVVEVSHDLDELYKNNSIKSMVNKYKLDTKGQCFYNSGKLSTTILDVKYCEGFISIGNIPLVEHSWIRYNGRYYDLTLEPSDINRDLILVKEFDISEICECQLRLRTWGPYIKDYFINNVYKNEKEDKANK
jgi:hypothetical protein